MSTSTSDWMAMSERQSILQKTAAAAQRRPAAKRQVIEMNFDYQTVLADFRSAMEDRGIAPPANIIADGKMHRCDAVGREGQRGAAYKLHMNGFPAGGFENHHDGRGWENWKADIEDTRTPEEKARAAQEYEENRRRRAAEARESQASAKDRAQWILGHSQETTTDHPYLVRKQVPAVGLSLYKGALVVPMHDVEGELHSLQFIKEDSSKTFLKAGRVEGCFFGLGEPGETLYIAEGYATAASIHQATGAGVAVAFNSGNLLAVARALRSKYPDKPMVICADDDAINVLRDPPVPNAGLIAAYETAREVGALVALPQFPEAPRDWRPGEKLRASVFRGIAAQVSMEPAARTYQPGVLPFIDDYVKQNVELAKLKSICWGDVALQLRAEKVLDDETDFNDLHLISGLHAVRKCIARAAPAPALEVQELSFDISI
jgi:phage/plasmid primase-like uncharacterized protein